MLITATYWLIGRHIVEFEQAGKAAQNTVPRLLKRLAVDLSARYGRGYSKRNLEQMRALLHELANCADNICAISGPKMIR